MEISKLVEAKGYKNSTVKICEYTRAKFFAIQETYSPIPVLGIGDPTWRLCEVNNDKVGILFIAPMKVNTLLAQKRSLMEPF